VHKVTRYTYFTEYAKAGQGMADERSDNSDKEAS
jgi:hypothetical protein